MGSYSDQVYQNARLSLYRFLADQPALATLKENIRPLEEFEPSRHQSKPQILLSMATPRWEPMGIDGGYWKEEVDVPNGKVSTIYASMGEMDFTLDLGTDVDTEREYWSAALDGIFKRSELSGITVYDFAADPNSMTEVGRLRFVKEEDVAHNFLPEHPEVRTWRDAIRFTPEYLHQFVMTPDQPMLTGVELRAKEISIL